MSGHARLWIGAALLASGCLSAGVSDVRVLGTSIERPDEAASHFDNCTGYVITGERAAQYFRAAKPVSPHWVELSDAGVMGPCSAHGRLLFRGAEADWRIYMGTLGFIERPGDERQWFYCDQGCCEKVREACG